MRTVFLMRMVMLAAQAVVEIMGINDGRNGGKQQDHIPFMPEYPNHQHYDACCKNEDGPPAMVVLLFAMV